MSLNQSRADKSESSRYRKSGRSGSFNQQRNSGGRGKGGGGPPAPPTSWSPSLSSNQSFKKSNNAQGGQSRTSVLDSNSDSNNASADLIAQNGAHFQPPLHGAADAPLIGANVKPTDVLTQKSTQPIPKVPSSNAATVMSDTTAPTTAAKAPADASKSFPLQFGSISPGFMNGMQIPARTSSVPPNLDEQKRDQARHDLLRAGLTLPMPSIPIPIPKQQLPRKAPMVTRVSDTPASLSQMTPPVVSTQSVTPSEVTAIPETSQAAIPPICRSSTPPAGTSIGAATQTVSMLDKVRIVRDRLERFVFPADISMIGARGTKGIIDTALEGLTQISVASMCLFSRFVQFSQLNSTVRGERLAHEAVKMEILAAQGRIAELEVDGKASEAKLVAIRERVALSEAACTRVEAELVATRERVVNLEAELVATCERATKLEIDGEVARLRAEAELKTARERVSRAEADLQLAHERAAKAEADSDSGLADAFIDGYEELRQKISVAFPNIDLSSFVPYEASDDVDGDDGDFDSA